MELCDLGIIPYRTISTPGSMILFFSYGKPVIVPNLLVVKEYCEQAKACVLYRRDRCYEGITDAIRGLLKEPEKIKKLARNAIMYREKITWDRIGITTVKYYLKLIEKGNILREGL